MRTSSLKYVLLPIVLARAFALDGQIGIHDPSTVVLCNGKFYTYGTGGTSCLEPWPPARAVPDYRLTLSSLRSCPREPLGL